MEWACVLCSLIAACFSSLCTCDILHLGCSCMESRLSVLCSLRVLEFLSMLMLEVCACLLPGSFSGFDLACYRAGEACIEVESRCSPGKVVCAGVVLYVVGRVVNWHARSAVIEFACCMRNLSRECMSDNDLGGSWGRLC
jgi:hypothetical protein